MLIYVVSAATTTPHGLTVRSRTFFQKRNALQQFLEWSENQASHAEGSDLVIESEHLHVRLELQEVADRRSVSDAVKLEVARRYREGGVSQVQLAREFGLSQALVSNIVRYVRIQSPQRGAP